jgi:hypothetical protein
VALDGCHLLHPQWVDDCIRAGALVAPLDPYNLPLGFARTPDRGTSPAGQDRSKGAWLFADDGAFVGAPRTSTSTSASDSTSSSGPGGSGSSGAGGSGGGKRASSSNSSDRRRSSVSGGGLGGFDKAPLQGLTLRVVCADKATAANLRVLVTAAGATCVECVAKASKAAKAAAAGGPPGGGGAGALLSPSKASAAAAALRASQWAMAPAAAKRLDAQICDELHSDEMRAACNQVPRAKVLTYEWLMQCLLHRRRLDDAAYLLRPACGPNATAADVDASWLLRDQAVKTRLFAGAHQGPLFSFLFLPFLKK